MGLQPQDEKDNIMTITSAQITAIETVADAAKKIGYLTTIADLTKWAKAKPSTRQTEYTLADGFVAEQLAAATIELDKAQRSAFGILAGDARDEQAFETAEALIAEHAARTAYDETIRAAITGIIPSGIAL